MAIFEMSSKKQKDGKRHFKAVLYKLQPPECVVNNVGTNGCWNENGITFIEEYSAKQLESIKDMSITCDFIDEDRTEISAHGETGELTKDGLPIFESNIIGHFNKGYIGDYVENGETYRVVYGDGVIDEFRNPRYVQILDESIANGEYPSGSIEIFRPVNSDHIEYLNGRFEQGRIPCGFLHSGYTLVLNPSDKMAKMIELNSADNKERKEIQTMDEKALALICESVKGAVSETNSKNAEYETQISELNAVVAEKEEKISELNAIVEKTQKALDDLTKECEAFGAEREALTKELGELKTAQKVGELNSAIAEFTEEQRDFAKEEIEAFNADPMKYEINSIVEKIYTEIGKKAQADAKAKALEVNTKEEPVDDIYGEIIETNSSEEEEISIY